MRSVTVACSEVGSHSDFSVDLASVTTSAFLVRPIPLLDPMGFPLAAFLWVRGRFDLVLSRSEPPNSGYTSAVD